jgi:hydroxylysine kinase
MAPTASWIRSKPRLELRQAATAAARWWAVRGDIEDLPSERDRNVLIRAEGRPAYVLKVSNLEEDRGLLECQERAMLLLGAAGVPVQPIIPASDGSTIVGLGDPGPPWARLLGWLPGQPLADVTDPDPSLWTDLGRTMGRSVAALLDLDHPAAHRVFHWDIQRAGSVVASGAVNVADPERRVLLSEVSERLRRDLGPRLPSLRRSIIHNDANDHNVLVDQTGSRVAGLLDFGDMVHSVTAQEAAVAGAYAMLGRDDPITVLSAIVRGFDAAFRLSADELDALPTLVIARLAASVSIAARQARLSEDPYLRVSEEPAWTLLARLAAWPPSQLRLALHEAVGR